MLKALSLLTSTIHYFSVLAFWSTFWSIFARKTSSWSTAFLLVSGLVVLVLVGLVVGWGRALGLVVLVGVGPQQLTGISRIIADFKC